LTKEDCRKLLLDYPDLNKAYELNVKMDSKDAPDENKNSDFENDDSHESVNSSRFAIKDTKAVKTTTGRSW